MLKIRTYQIQDKDAVIQLWKKCNLVVAWNDPEKDIQRKIAIAPQLFLVGQIEQKIIATVMGGYEGHRGWIHYLAVDPNHQGHGHGKAIMQAIEKKLLEQGCPKINLQVRASNTEVIDFYQSLGYKQDEVISLGKRLIPDD